MKWQEIMGIGINPDPPVKEPIPGLLAAIFFYILVFLVSYTTFRVSKFILPTRLHSITTDFLKAMMICTYPYGHAQIRELYGHIGYFITVVPLTVFTVSAFPEGHGSPLNIFLEYVRGQVSIVYLVFRSLVQTLGAFTSYKLAEFVWSLRIHSFYTRQLNTTACSSDLKVSVEVGCVLECICVAFDTWLSYQKLTRFPVLDSILKSANSAIMVCLGVHLTGMYLHPAMASGLSFFCQGSSALEHVSVYWISAFIGCYLGHMINARMATKFTAYSKEKPSKSRRRRKANSHTDKKEK